MGNFVDRFRIYQYELNFDSYWWVGIDGLRPGGCFDRRGECVELLRDMHWTDKQIGGWDSPRWRRWQDGCVHCLPSAHGCWSSEEIERETQCRIHTAEKEEAWEGMGQEWQFYPILNTVPFWSDEVTARVYNNHNLQKTINADPV